MNRYRVELTVGDEFGYNKAGDVFYINEDEVEETLKNGYRYVKLFHYGEDDAVFFYPCKIIREQYELTSSYPVGNSERDKIKQVRYESDNYDWKDHWP